jgi:nitroimidazol reductase NimA-like FMN-containing flavoprotein (pyridoxamine 5'-phosphate oxidase superfamily)
MGITLSDEEAWAFLQAGHTGILSTMRADGYPIALPVWYAVDDHVIYTRTPATASKLKRIRRNPRASFLVEHGLHWRELQAVVISVDAQIIEDEAGATRVFELMNAKYEAFRTVNLPDASKRHYSTSTAIALKPAGSFVTWDNSRLRLPSNGPPDSNPSQVE